MSAFAAGRRGWIRPLAVGAGLLPFASLVVRGVQDALGADPIEEITHVTGRWALRLLLVSLAVTPARRWLGLGWAAPLRRSFGLLAFFYASLHLFTYVVLDQELDFPLLLEDVLERRYVTAGFAAFLCLLALALTSTKGMMKRLGRRWKQLHRLAYVAGVAAVVHYLWLVKADLVPPLAHAAVLALLLGARLVAPPRRAVVATRQPRR